MRRNHIFLLLLILVLQAAPYLTAQLQWGSAWVFSGFLLNPIDGNTYLSKMQEGWAGEWRFYLLYSPDGGKGAFLFLFYLFLGHLARWFSIPLLLVFHAARMLSILALFGALRTFCSRVYLSDRRSADFALWLVLLGGGMGWSAALASGFMTGDFWIAEAYPFLSMLANPHFPLGLAILVWILTIDLGPSTRWSGPTTAVLGLLLAVIQPFGLVILAGLMLGRVIWHWVKERRFAPYNMVWALSMGGIFLLYQYWSIRTDPVLALWDGQNLTPALEGWDFALSMLPALAFALIGIWAFWKQPDDSIFILVFWLVFAVILVYMPFNLQRRFMTGIYVPIALLGAAGASWMTSTLRPAGRWAFPLLLGFSLLTNLLILVSSVFTARGLVDGQPDRRIFLPSAEVEAMGWLRDNTPQDAVVLARAATGLFIPAWSGRRVVYGHPYESIHAEQQKENVSAYFEGRMSEDEAGQLLRDNHVTYIFVEISEQDSNQTLPLLNKKVYDEDGFSIYQVGP